MISMLKKDVIQYCYVAWIRQFCLIYSVQSFDRETLPFFVIDQLWVRTVSESSWQIYPSLIICWSLEHRRIERAILGIHVCGWRLYVAKYVDSSSWVQNQSSSAAASIELSSSFDIWVTLHGFKRYTSTRSIPNDGYERGSSSKSGSGRPHSLIRRQLSTSQVFSLHINNSRILSINSNQKMRRVFLYQHHAKY